MPTYSYRCTNCDKTFDAFHSMMCSDPQNCPECGAIGKKLMSASSVIFKGSGFYSTDYRDSGYLEAKRNDSDNAASTSSAKSDTSKSDTDTAAAPKPEAKTESTAKSDAAKPAAPSPVTQAA